MMLVVRRLQGLARKKDTPLFMCFSNFTKASDSVDRTLPFADFVLACLGIPPACGRACGRMMAGARICSTWGRVFCKGVARDIGVQTFYTVVLRVADERFTADAVIMDSMVQLQRK